jgi:hypothetical protein
MRKMRYAVSGKPHEILDKIIEAESKVRTDELWRDDPFDPLSFKQKEKIKKTVAFAEANPEVWEVFKKHALYAAVRNRPSGAQNIWERMRYEIYVELAKPDPDFRLNNDYVAFYPRLFMHRFPQYKEFFETRRSCYDKVIYENIFI